MIDELWEKYAYPINGVGTVMLKDFFQKAMTKYGEHIKAEAVKVCEAEYTCEGIAQRCAAAIERMEIK